MSAKKGRCLCGAVSFEYEGPENWRAHCHCDSCRRATSSPFTTYLGVPREKFRWTGETPAAFASSPGVTRRFCGKCGSPMAYEAEKYAHEIHLFAACLEDHSGFRPQGHVFYAERVVWVEPADKLPKFDTTAGG